MRLCWPLLSLLFASSVDAEPVTVAVASNFVAPMGELVAEFEQATGHLIQVSPASTGVLYAAARNGARYAALLAADIERPRRLEQEGIGVPGSRFTYAIGTLVLWSADPELAGSDCRSALDDLGKRRLAIANPVTAPYGAAAKSFLQDAGLWKQVQDNLVFGQNIAQTLQFVATRNASLGLIAASQVNSEQLPAATCQWVVPAATHPPIEQQAILLKQGAGTEVAAAFLEFVGGPAGRAIIAAQGYEVPD
jgi:molybdate transport system substrate-binding protein